MDKILNINSRLNDYAVHFVSDTSYLDELKKIPHSIFVNYYSGLGETAKLMLMGGKSDTEKYKQNLMKLDQRDESALLESMQRTLNIKKSYNDKSDRHDSRRSLCGAIAFKNSYLIN